MRSRSSRNRRRCSNSSVAASPPLISAVGLPKFEIVNELEPAGHADDEHARVDEGEQVAGHSSVDNSSNEDSVICTICFDTIMTQRVGTPDVCNHTFCAECIKKWAKNNNICPVDRQKFNTIHVRRHLKGEIIDIYNVRLKRQEYCSFWCIVYMMLVIFFIIIVALFITSLCEELTRRTWRPASITVPHSKKANVTFTGYGKCGTTGRSTKRHLQVTVLWMLMKLVIQSFPPRCMTTKPRGRYRKM
jgi:hypothetical protein